MILSTQSETAKTRDDELLRAYESSYRAGVTAAVRAIEKGPAEKARDWWRQRHGRAQRRTIKR